MNNAKHQDTIRKAMRPKIGQPAIVSRLQAMIGELGIVDSMYDRKYSFTTMRFDDKMLEGWIEVLADLIEEKKP